MNTQNIRCKFILSFTTINCTQICNKMLKFTKTEAHTHTQQARRHRQRGGTQTDVQPRRGAAPGVEPPLHAAELLRRLRRRLLLIARWARVFWGSTYERPGRPVIAERTVCLSSKLILVLRGDLSRFHAFFIVLRATPWTFNHTTRRATSDAGRAP